MNRQSMHLPNIMTRPTKWTKFWMHIFYLMFLSYLVTQRTFRIITFHRLDRFGVDMKHILIWNDLPGLQYEGQKHFADKRCEIINCYFTKNKTLFGDLRYFDAIVFNVEAMRNKVKLPKLRSATQKYIFVAKESADNFPVCDPVYDNFFNWSWTYRSDSIIPFSFISLYNLEGQYLGNYLKWNRLRPIDKLLKEQLASKHKAAAVFLDECESRSKREVFIKDLQRELADYNHTVDVFGDCGPLKCKKGLSLSNCYYRLRKKYYFFLALEDSIAPDFVTDVVLHAYKNNVVPVVYGGAKYESFLPPNSFIDSKKYNISALAKKMVDVIRNRNSYYDYFRWKNHCYIDKSPVLDPCTLCEKLNTPSMIEGTHTYTQFRKWWNYKFESRCSKTD